MLVIIRLSGALPHTKGGFMKKSVVVLFLLMSTLLNASDKDKTANGSTNAAAPPPPPRIATKPSRGAVRRRLEGKAIRSTVKSNRKRPEDNDEL